MKTQINKQNIFLTVLTLVVLLIINTSCVSKKKYDAALEEIARLSVDSTFQTYETADIAYTKDSIIYDQKDAMLNQAYKIDTLKRTKRTKK